MILKNVTNKYFIVECKKDNIYINYNITDNWIIIYIIIYNNR